MEDMRAALRQSAGKVISVLQTLDSSGDGLVSREEFRANLPRLGFDVPERAAVDAILNDLDTDGSGSISYAELKARLRHGLDVKLATKLREGAVAFQTEAANPKYPLRRGGERPS